MEINVQNLDRLFFQYNAKYQNGFGMRESYWEKIADKIPSGSQQQLYPWLGRTTNMREWIGERQLQNLELHGYTIVNRDFESTIELDRNVIEDDVWNVYGSVFTDLGQNTATFLDKEIGTWLSQATANIDGAGLAPYFYAYDGVTMFSANGHPVGKQNSGPTTLTANVINSGSSAWWYLFYVGRALKPLIVQERKPFQFVRMDVLTDERVFMQKKFRYGVDGRYGFGPGFWQFMAASNQDLNNADNYAALRTLMRNIKQDNGEPFGLDGMGAGKWVLMVPPSFEQAGLTLINASLVAGSAGGRGSATGPYSNQWVGSAELVVNTFLTDTFTIL